MTNKEYARQFQLLANLMELHEESSYRIKSYSNAYRILRGEANPVHEMSLAEVKKIRGIGDAIGLKIQELRLNNKMKVLEEYKLQTPQGIVEMMQIKGLGVKKIKLLWQEMGIESPGELWYACNENRLIKTKGFGTKTQANIKQQLEYYFQSKNKFHYATLEDEAQNLVMDIQEELGLEQVALTGKMRRLEPVIETIDILIAQADIQAVFDNELLNLVSHEEGSALYTCETIEQSFPVRLITCPSEFWGYNLIRTTGNENFVKDFFEQHFSPAIDWKKTNPASLEGLDEAAVFAKAEIPYILPELRDLPKISYKAKAGPLPTLIEESDIKGIVHAHSTWSDGSNSLEQMAKYCQEQGYEYLGITDHSKSAFYANGLTVERVLEQMEEIDKLNEKMAPFRIFKGIESDILGNGSLDYTDDILEKFDFIIASVHAHLRMDKEKATQRLLTAIKNPFTTILGHPTGRLLLSRQGYPLDHERIIEACAEHNVVIELNANPLRLDLDYTWIPYALELGVKIAINPDAHSLQGVHDVHWGVLAARKGGLTKETCISTLGKDEFAALISK